MLQTVHEVSSVVSHGDSVVRCRVGRGVFVAEFFGFDACSQFVGECFRTRIEEKVRGMDVFFHLGEEDFCTVEIELRAVDVVMLVEVDSSDGDVIPSEYGVVIDLPGKPFADACEGIAVVIYVEVDSLRQSKGGGRSSSTCLRILR